MSEEANENNEHMEYAIGVSWCADELLDLIEQYEEGGYETEVSELLTGGDDD